MIYLTNENVKRIIAINRQLAQIRAMVKRSELTESEADAVSVPLICERDAIRSQTVLQDGISPPPGSPPKEGKEPGKAK